MSQRVYSTPGIVISGSMPMTRTSQPCRTSRSTSALPTRPLPPVTNTRIALDSLSKRTIVAEWERLHDSERDKRNAAYSNKGAESAKQTWIANGRSQSRYVATSGAKAQRHKGAEAQRRRGAEAQTRLYVFSTFAPLRL